MTDFHHQQAAHCESGVAAALFTRAGLPLSEPMALGLANALAFAYIPLVKLAGQPLVAYRLPPKFIIKGLCKRLGAKVCFRSFRDPLAGAQALDDALAAGSLVGLQTSVYYLPYFPEEMRFHFNAHNLLVYGRDGNDYRVSDPVFEEPVTVSGRALNKARFVRGPLAPKGLMYHIESIPKQMDYRVLVPEAIARNVRVMLSAPLPVIGIRGIRFLARRIERLKGSVREQRLFLGHIVRMQEEIGTGGAGFRFMYASFLQEAAERLEEENLEQASRAMTAVGDLWREFALALVKECRNPETLDRATLADALRCCAAAEEQVWQDLRYWSRRGRSSKN
ncbi:BtrH N-terminal domain-containing protein [Marinimicrobium sp. ARAG 43.8]|uniref:BtrH N-terminal domain-containing protein n=1 Tax=Marinimicrobium sp. ARAG 43.8 TaxID=3418719 RepID=UPI003CF038F6